MRLSVILMDALVFLPALLLFARVWQGTRSARTQVSCRFGTLTVQFADTLRQQELSLLTLLFQPALLLVDFGHFQYNSVMLGMFRLCRDGGDVC